MAITMYIAATVSGMMFTLCRVHMPGVPYPLSHWSYGMLAPFQSYLAHNDDLVALGRHSGGLWEAIEMDKYRTHGKGEESIRILLPMHRGLQKEGLSEKYDAYAEQLKTLEMKHGNMWEEITLEMHRWPRSPGGYEFLRVPIFTTVTKL
jgi:hypothetical protein